MQGLKCIQGPDMQLPSSLVSTISWWEPNLPLWPDVDHKYRPYCGPPGKELCGNEPGRRLWNNILLWSMTWKRRRRMRWRLTLRGACSRRQYDYQVEVPSTGSYGPF